MNKEQLKALLVLLNEQNVREVEFKMDLVKSDRDQVPLPTKIVFNKERPIVEASEAEISVTHYNLFNDELGSLPSDIRAIVLENLEEKAEEIVTKELNSLRYRSS